MVKKRKKTEDDSTDGNKKLHVDKENGTSIGSEK